MTDKPAEFPEELEQGQELVEQDSTAQNLQAETLEQVSYQREIEYILQDQVVDIQNDPKAQDVLRQLDEDENCRHSLQSPEQKFAESFSKPGSIYVPIKGKAASMEDLSAFYHRLPISPDLFQESLVEKVYGTKFTAKPNTPERLRERQSHFEKLRKLFALLTSLPHQRDYERGRNQSRRMFVIPESVDENAHGKILISRKAPDRRINSVFEDIYTAERSLAHIVNNYDGTISERDVEKMGEFKALLNLTDKLQLVIDFIQKWKTTSKQEKQEMGNLLVEAQNLLLHCHNPLKESALGRVTDSLEFTDSRGQVNPCATAPKILAMGKNLFDRLNEILSIKSYIVKDQGIVKTVVQPIQISFYTGTQSLGTMLQSDFFAEIDVADTKSTSNVKYKTAKVQKDINGPAGILKKFEKILANKHMVAPFVQYAKALLSNYEIVNNLLKYIEENRNGLDAHRLRSIHDELCKYAITGFSALKVQHIHRNYNDVLLDVLQNPQTADFDEIRKQLQSLAVRLRPRQFGMDFAIREDLKFEIPVLDELYEHNQFVISSISTYKRQKLELEIELHPLELEIEEGKSDEQKVERVIELKTELNNLQIAFTVDLRGIMKQFDFDYLVKELTVQDDPDALTEAIISQLS